MSECQTKAGNQECFEKLEKLSLSLLSLLSQLSLSHSLSLDMLNNFCFHVYAQKSLFKVENVNAYLLTSSSSAASAPREFANHRAGSQLKIIGIFTCKQRHLSIDMKTKVVQHVKSEWMRDWKSVRVRECENNIKTFRHSWLPAFVWHSEFFFMPLTSWSISSVIFVPAE